jgi:selenocysteine lyase/cysteine desulfurase
MLRCQADEFSLPEGVHYLNGAYMSPLLRSVEEAGIAAIRRKRFPVDITPVDFFDPADAARERFARLVGATDPERVAILPAVSYGVAVAARNTPLAAGQNIVLVEGQFPSNALIWHRRARERGATVRTVPAPDRARGRSDEWNERALEAIDADTAVLAMAPLHWTDGTRFDLTALGHRAREVGAVFVVDGTQAVGAQPIDVAAVGVDALIVAAYKWLLGPYSLAFGWFGSRFDGGTPLEEAWLARTGSDDFRSLVHYVDEYRPAAARYDVGGRSNFTLLPMAIAAMDQILGWGVREIEAYCRVLTRELFEPLERAGFEADHPGGRGAHLFGLQAPAGVNIGALQEALERRRVFVSLRGAAIRVSPNVYNTPDDIVALRSALLEAARAPA